MKAQVPVSQTPTVAKDTKYGPLLTLPLGPTREFSFGPAKAHAVLRWLSAVQDFAKLYPAKAEDSIQDSATPLSPTDAAKLV